MNLDGACKNLEAIIDGAELHARELVQNITARMSKLPGQIKEKSTYLKERWWGNDYDDCAAFNARLSALDLKVADVVPLVPKVIFGEHRFRAEDKYWFRRVRIREPKALTEYEVPLRICGNVYRLPSDARIEDNISAWKVPFIYVAPYRRKH